ncbi:MAG: rRNA maturation RNase YbeY [Chloroflexi bacterium HGW-Chloroflexi-3]|nr:MAG: rRNA maturation RNase YbeY [Chloroflexi bacterium HGW-Chloroflexi-3]
MNQTSPEVIIINEDKFNIPDDIGYLISSILILENEPLDKVVTIIFINEGEMKELYNKYYGYAQSTDVLSFDAGEIDPDSGKEIMGDIVICYPFVDHQSLKLGNELFDEIKLMVIHGMLHLLGYDHNTVDQKSDMWKSQNKILMSNGIKLNQIPE